MNKVGERPGGLPTQSVRTKRAKTNEQIVEGIIIMRRIEGPLAPEWKEFVREALSKIIDALSNGNATRDVQKQAGRLIEALALRRRGRPKRRLKTPLANFDFSLTVDTIAARYAAQGHDDPFKAALADARACEKEESGILLSDQTLRDYYRRGVADRARVDQAFALRLESAARNSPLTDHQAAIERLLIDGANGDAENLYLDSQSYARGLRRLKKSAEKK
jgi:hypothetical protein